ncbi:MAG: hypothetical protein HKO98_08965 [Gemmatimonadetes bacterium]|nr:hypothetical protein [Gemmatimonadota bacterium]
MAGSEDEVRAAQDDGEKEEEAPAPVEPPPPAADRADDPADDTESDTPVPAVVAATGSQAAPSVEPEASALGSSGALGSRRPLFAGLGVAAVAVIAVIVALSGGGEGSGPAPDARETDRVDGPGETAEPGPIADPAPADDPLAPPGEDPGSVPGVVRVAGDVPDDARLRVTGEDVDEEGAPGELTLRPGDYRLELRAAGFQTASTAWTVAAGDTSEWRPDLVPVTEDPPAPPPPGRIRVLGDLPPGAVVRVRGNGVDRRGLDFELAPGAYSLEASASGHRTVRTDMTVLSGATREWRPSLPVIPVTPPPARDQDSVRTLPETPTTTDPPTDEGESAGVRAAAIASAIRGFADALQSRDPARLRAAYPTVEQNWLQFIGSDAIRNLRVDASGFTVPPEGDRVDVPFTLRLDYDSGAPAPGARPYRATVERQNGAWVMVGLQSGG